MEQFNVFLFNTRLLLLWSNSMYALSTQDSYSYGAIRCMPLQHKITTLMEQFNVCLFNTRFLLLCSNSMYAFSTQDSYSYGAIQCMPFQHKIPTLMEQFNECLFILWLKYHYLPLLLTFAPYLLLQFCV